MHIRSEKALAAFLCHFPARLDTAKNRKDRRGMVLMVLVLSTLGMVPTLPARSQTFDCTTVTDVPASDCEALVALYEATDGDNWTASTGWLGNTTVGNWHGVSVRGGRVTSLFLSGNQLSGTIPPELGNLTALEWLYLPDNQLSGMIPTEIGNIAALEALVLFSNQLTGTIPPELGNLPALNALYLTDNQLTGAIPPELGNLAALKELYIDNNPGITGTLPLSLTAVPLRLFWFNNTGLCEPPDAAFQNWLNGIAILRRTGVLCSGDAICETVTDVPTTDCEALVALYDATDGDNWTTNTGWLTDTTVGNWHGVTVSGGRVTLLVQVANQLNGTIPPDLGNLNALQGLILFGNQLTGSIPPDLDDLNALEVLDLSDNQLTGAIPSELGNLANLSVLYLSVNQLTGAIPQALSSLDLLQELGLDNNTLSGSLPAALGNLANLTFLRVDNNAGLTGPLPLSLTAVPLSTFGYNNTGLCEPPDEAFQAWLNGIFSLQRTGVLCSTGPICDTVTDVPTADCEALVALYNTTNGDNWNNNSGWLTDNTVGNWHGVSVSNGHVTELSLPTNQLSGSIPPELGNLTALEVLFLAQNRLNGSIPPELGNLTTLRVLRLYQNQLTGSVPTALGNLTALETLHLFSNQLTGLIPPVLSNLTALESLSFSNNQLTGTIPSELGNLTSLAGLWFDGNTGLSGPLPLSFVNLPLTRFRFNNTGLCEPPDAAFQNWLNGISNLGRTDVLCSGDAICETVTDVSATDCEALVALYNATDGDTWTTNTGWLTDTTVGNWHGVIVSGGRATRLLLSENQLTGAIPTELGNLTALEGLNLSFNQLTGAIPTELGNLTALEVLWLHENPGLTGALPLSLTAVPLSVFWFNNTGMCEPPDAAFQAWLDGITDLQRTGVLCSTGPFCDTVTDVPTVECEALMVLYEETNGDNWTTNTGWLTDTTVGNWHGVTVSGGHATRLLLSDNQLSGQIPPELGNLAALQRLLLSRNQLTGPIPPELGNLPALEWLLLSTNQLTGPIPPELGNLPALERLNLFQNQLTGQMPPELGNLAALKELYIHNNPGLTGALPLSLTAVPLSVFWFNNTGLCEPPDADFQAWLDGITDLQRTGVLCSSGPFTGTLAEIREQPLGTRITTNGVIGRVFGSRVYFQDNTGGLALQATESFQNSIDNGTFAPGTSLRVTGTLSESNGVLLVAEEDLESAAIVAGAPRIPPTPAEVTLQEISTNGERYESVVVRVAGVTIETGNATFSASTNYPIRDATLGTGTMMLQVPRALDSELPGIEIPPSPVVFTGVVGQFTTGAPNTGYQLVGINVNDVIAEGGSAFCSTVTDVPTSDCAALEALYNATAGDNWTTNTGWINGTTVGTWHGVTVNGGRVTVVDLGSNRLNGSIPSSLGNLSGLRNLILGDNPLGGSIPPALGNLAQLESLDLRSSQLTGTIPAELGNLANLTFLGLGRNSLSGALPATLGNMTSIVVMDIGSNALSGAVPESLGALSNMRELYLSSNQLTGPLPVTFVNLSLNIFDFNNTGLCEPSEAGFQNWLAGISDLGRTGVPCSTGTGIDTAPGVVPDAFVLEGNYPNPFNPVTTIRYSVPHPGSVTVHVYDAMGRLVATPVQGPVATGRHEVLFGTDGLASGLYVYTVVFEGERRVGRMTLLK